MKDWNRSGLEKGSRACQAKRVDVQSPQGGTQPSLFKDLQDHCPEPGTEGGVGRGCSGLEKELLGFILAVVESARAIKRAWGRA